MKNTLKESILLIALLSGFCQVTQAEWVTIQIEGVVDYVDDSGNYLQGKIDVCDTFTGWYTYDTLTPDLEPELWGGSYWHTSSPAGVSILINDLLFETNFDDVQFSMAIGNDRNGDMYRFISNNNIDLSNGTHVDSILWQLNDFTGSALSSDALPATPPNLNQWEYNRLSLSGDSFFITAHVTSATPEPSTLLLLALGAFGLVSRKTSRH